MSNYDWAYPNTVWFGNDRIKELAKACKILGISRPLFVTDKDLVKTKIVEDTLQINKKANLTTSVFSDQKVILSVVMLKMVQKYLKKEIMMG